MQTELKLKYEICEQAFEKIPVIIVAAGNSTRMGTNKQFMQILGFPVIARTLMAFENSPVISRIILVVRADDIFSYQMLTEKYKISKVSDIVCGGSCRQDSVLKGFERLNADDKSVLIHDGARPLVTEKIIQNVATALKDNVAVTCGIKLKDTVKKIDKNGKIVKTLKRESLIAVQTPQGVWVKEYLSATKKAVSVENFTDDTSIMEWAGYDCYCVEGSYKNIKITTLEDIVAAEGYLKEEDV